MNVRRVLVCSYGVPSPDRDSGSRRLMDFIEFLTESGWRVDFCATNPTSQSQARTLHQLGIAVHPADQLESVLANGHFELILTAFWPVAEFVIPLVRQYSPFSRIIVDSVDLHYLRDARRILSGATAALDGAVLGEEYGAQIVGELNAYAAADMVLAVSSKEVGKLEDLLGNRTPALCAPDCEELPALPMSFADRRGILTVGSYQHPPNVDAVEFLCRDVLPLLPTELIGQHPVYIVGNALDERIRRFGADLASVRMVGWVPTVTEYFARTRISVVPLRYGAGTKRKMVQALMSGTPTVTTEIGAEGLELVPEEHVLIANTPQDFAQSIIRLVTDEELWNRLAKNGREHILKLHSRQLAKTRFIEAIEQTLTLTPKGSMLRNGGRERYQSRVEYQYFQNVADIVREVGRDLQPSDSTLIVAGPGMSGVNVINQHAVFQLSECTNDSRLEPNTRGRTLAARLAELRSKGATYLILPETAQWWMEHFADFRTYIEKTTEELPARSKCRIFLLTNVTTSSTELASRQSPHPLPLTNNQGTNSKNSVRLIAFYLPQFHPIPENNNWWGEGFTEWTNVAKSKALFADHYQPHLPADLGYYDLRLAETRNEQADLARSYGIYGFCYYHYWFNGKMLLERPFNEVLASGEPDFPFCLCWANEPWSRRWDGRPADVLQPQTYSAEDDLAHIRWLIPALSDPRAIQVDGKPLLLIYQGKELPEPGRTVDIWRREVDRAGLPGIHLVAVETGWDAGWDATEVGFDAKVLFQPQFSLLNSVPRLPVGSSRLRVFDYDQSWPVLANPQPVSYQRYDCVFPMWDNTARKGEDGWVIHNASAASYERWLRLSIERTLDRSSDKRIVFVNAWNEWAEGCHLEPDQKYGHLFLEATRRAIHTVQSSKPFTVVQNEPCNTPANSASR